MVVLNVGGNPFLIIWSRLLSLKQNKYTKFKRERKKTVFDKQTQKKHCLYQNGTSSNEDTLIEFFYIKHNNVYVAARE
jgi:hypothetical protein